MYSFLKFHSFRVLLLGPSATQLFSVLLKTGLRPIQPLAQGKMHCHKHYSSHRQVDIQQVSASL